ncbi:hypothetical protein FRC12_016816, partial [Ceratobasidium sp. 428]
GAHYLHICFTLLILTRRSVLHLPVSFGRRPTCLPESSVVHILGRTRDGLRTRCVVERRLEV